MKETRTYPLRLPRSLKEAVERLSRADGAGMNQFNATAVAGPVSAQGRRDDARGAVKK